MTDATRSRPSITPALVGAGILAAAVGIAFVLSAVGASRGERPHIDHVTLPQHRMWQVVSVEPYEGLEEIELLKFNWPTREDAHFAFALSREGLKVGDQVCLDHVREIDTFWAHPVPEGGCAARLPVGR